MLGGLGGIGPPAGLIPPDSGGRCWLCPPVAGPDAPTAGDMDREEDEPVGEGVGLRPLGVTARGSFLCVPSSAAPSFVDRGGGVGPGLCGTLKIKKRL